MPEAFKMMFIVALSSKLGYSVLGKTGTENSALFSYIKSKIWDDS